MTEISPHDSNRISTLLAPLAAIHPNYALTTQAIEIYVNSLADLDPCLLEAAIMQAINTSRFFPTPAELREIAFELAEMAQGIPTAYEAWEELLTYIRRGYHHNGTKPDFSDPLIARAAQSIGGFHEIGRSTNLQSERARFIDAYREFRKQHHKRERLHPTIKALLPTIENNLLTAPIET